MTLALYSYESNISQSVSDKNYIFKIDVDDNEPDEVTLEDGTKAPNPMKKKMKFIFETSDGLEPLFNHIYNKSEVKALVQSGMDPTQFRNSCFNAVNTLLKELMNTYIALSYIKSSKKLAMIDKSVKTSYNATYELWQWTTQNMIAINYAHNELVDYVSGINSCHCGDKGGLAEQVQDLMYEFTRLVNPHNKLLTPLGMQFTQIYKNWFAMAAAELQSKYGAKSPDVHTTYIDLDDCMNSLEQVDDPYERDVDVTKPVYGPIKIPFDINVNGFINGVDVTKLTPSESYFTHHEGFSKYYVKNESVELDDYTFANAQCKRLKIIDVPQTTLQKLQDNINPLNVFRFMLRKNEIYDANGAYVKDFYAEARSGKMYCPVILMNPNNDIMKYEIHAAEIDLNTEKPFIAFDTQITLNIYNMFINGDMSIMYLLDEELIKCDVPTIKCDIIDAKNALRLHESNVLYLYKPTAIGENEDYYTMMFKIPDDYVIPLNTEFIFSDKAFNNVWYLRWNGAQWLGNNVQGHVNGRASHKQDSYMWTNPDMVLDYKILTRFNVKHDDATYFAIKRLSPSLTKDEHYAAHLFRNNLIRWYFILNDGSRRDFDINDFFDNYENVNKWWYKTAAEFGVESLAGYDCGGINARWNSDRHFVWKELYGEITLDNITTQVKYLRNGEEDRRHWLYGDAILETIEHIGFHHEDTNIQNGVKDITLQFLKSAAVAVDEVKYDTRTNAFQFIIDNQFYSVSPNPNAASTLYTDYNITSSKIITADNINTMRSDLNMLTNTADVISYDVNVVKGRVDGLTDRVTIAESKITSAEAHLQTVDGQISSIKQDCEGLHQITDHIEAEVDEVKGDIKTLKIEAGIGLALSSLAVVGSAASIGLSLSAKGISFAAATAEAVTEETVISGASMWELAGGTESELLLADLSEASWSSFSSVALQGVVGANMTALKSWLDSAVRSCSFEENNHVISTKAVMEIINHNNTFMKAPFKIVYDKIQEIEANGVQNTNTNLSNVRTIDDLGYTRVTKAATPFNFEKAPDANVCYVQMLKGNVTIRGTILGNKFEVKCPENPTGDYDNVPYFGFNVLHDYYVVYAEFVNSTNNYHAIIKIYESAIFNVNAPALTNYNIDFVGIDKVCVEDKIALKSDVDTLQNKINALPVDELRLKSDLSFNNKVFEPVEFVDVPGQAMVSKFATNIKVKGSYEMNNVVHDFNVVLSKYKTLTFSNGEKIIKYMQELVSNDVSLILIDAKNSAGMPWNENENFMSLVKTAADLSEDIIASNDCFVDNTVFEEVSVMKDALDTFALKSDIPSITKLRAKDDLIYVSKKPQRNLKFKKVRNNTFYVDDFVNYLSIKFTYMTEPNNVNSLVHNVIIFSSTSLQVDNDGNVYYEVYESDINCNIRYYKIYNNDSWQGKIQFINFAYNVIMDLVEASEVNIKSEIALKSYVDDRIKALEAMTFSDGEALSITYPSATTSLARTSNNYITITPIVNAHFVGRITNNDYEFDFYFKILLNDASEIKTYKIPNSIYTACWNNATFAFYFIDDNDNEITDINFSSVNETQNNTSNINTTNLRAKDDLSYARTIQVDELVDGEDLTITLVNGYYTKITPMTENAHIVGSTQDGGFTFDFNFTVDSRDGYWMHKLPGTNNKAVWMDDLFMLYVNGREKYEVNITLAKKITSQKVNTIVNDKLLTRTYADEIYALQTHNHDNAYVKKNDLTTNIFMNNDIYAKKLTTHKVHTRCALFSCINEDYDSYNNSFTIECTRMNITTQPNTAPVYVYELTFKYNDTEVMHVRDSGQMWHKSSMTISHYCPAEDDINDYNIGAALFMSGKVYKRVGNEWFPSTDKDAQDCICGVKTEGTLKQFVGICVEVDAKNKSVKFATHGDYLLKVDDSRIYKVGDEIYMNDRGELNILTDDTIITAKIKRGILGVITGIINESVIAVLKS